MYMKKGNIYDIIFLVIKMEVKIQISARHVHLTESDFKYLFGDTKLTKLKDLTQPGEYACNEMVNLITDGGRIDNVRIVGPLRSYTQVEISKTDSYKLKLDPPVRDSGDLEDSESLMIEHDGKVLNKSNCCIIANRHIHINTSEMNKYNLRDGDIVKIKVNGEKGGILDNVSVKSNDHNAFEAHLDVDDGNAHLIKPGSIGEVIYE